MKIDDIRMNFERRMREVTVYGLVPYDATPITAADPVQNAHLRIDVLVRIVNDILDELEADKDDMK